jgi:uncharacterized membrane protein YtjA (UPF0391 family)
MLQPEPDSASPIGPLTNRSSVAGPLRNRCRNPVLCQVNLLGRHRRGSEVPEQAMTILKWALIFFLVSVVAGVLGFTGISAASADIARFLFYVFVVIFLVLLILGLTIFRA